MNKLLFLLAVLILTFQQCSSPTGPPPVKPVKNPREYTWTIDTLVYMTGIETAMKSIYASSPNDVYVVGSSSDWRGRMWHFDGKQWKLMYFPGGQSYYLSDIYGFSANDIWVAGGKSYRNPNPPPNYLVSSIVMHYDGTAWNYLKTTGGGVLISVWGSSPNNVWFGGVNGTLFHWDGNEIKRDSIPFISPQHSTFHSIHGKLTGETYFLVSSLLTGVDYLFSNKQNKWSVIDSSNTHRNNFWNNIWISEKGNIYESGSGGFYKWTGNSWTNLFDSFYGETVGIAGTSNDNIFIVGVGSSAGSGGEYTTLVYHYNGKDLYLYENLKLDDVVLYDVWTDGMEVFIVGATRGFPVKTIILHGK